ncbi:MAG TPA: glycosyltransferase family 4 protein [Steroidobacteraceae bacterium]|nr:glycosyltransferase family 4 protein [Steroidobacteraceae bacterium]
MKTALVVNLGSPEMDRLAAELASRAALLGMVRRYANKQRGWERALASLPLLGGIYASTLGRRLPPAGLPAGRVMEAGVLADFSLAVTNRIARLLPAIGSVAGRWLLSKTEQGVAHGARRHVRHAEVVVANYHVAAPAFEAARAAGRRTILNYPIAHHRWQYGFYAEQARLRPDYAAALPDFGDVTAHGALLDREISLADEILVGSSFVKRTFVSQGVAADRIHVVPYGVDLDRFGPGRQGRSPDSPFRILFVGQIGERKGISYLLDAYRGCRDPATELHLVGDFVRGGAVYERDRHLFRHTANVPQARLPELMRGADVFVFPTLVEGLGMVVIEAMACGLPVIVTPSGPDEIVRDGVDGFVVPIRDSAAIADRLERLRADPGLRARMGAAALQRAAEWSWSRYAHAAADIVVR